MFDWLKFSSIFLVQDVADNLFVTNNKIMTNFKPVTMDPPLANLKDPFFRNMKLRGKLEIFYD